MRKRFLPVVAALAAMTLALTACGSDDNNGDGSGTGNGDNAGKVGVILPDAATSPRGARRSGPVCR